MKDWKDWFSEEPPKDHLAKISQEAKPILEGMQPHRRSFFYQLMVPAFALLAGVVSWLVIRTSNDPPKNMALSLDEDFLLFSQIDDEEFDVIADLEFLESWDEHEKDVG